MVVQVAQGCLTPATLSFSVDKKNVVLAFARPPCEGGCACFHFRRIVLGFETYRALMGQPRPPILDSPEINGLTGRLKTRFGQNRNYEALEFVNYLRLCLSCGSMLPERMWQKSKALPINCVVDGW